MKCPYCGQPDPGVDICFACGRRLPLSPVAGPAAAVGSAILPPGTVLRGRFEISSEKWPNGKTWNEGGQGIVYYAVDRQAENKQCVVKQVKEPVTSGAVLQKLQEEGKRMAELSRAIGGRMAEILEDFVENGRFYVVEQRIFGETLLSVSDRMKPLKETDVLGWIIQCCRILQRIHDRKAIHRNINPDNLMLTPQGDIVVIDFGTLIEFRRIVHRAQGMGMLGYTSPEQWAGRPVPQSDIFALGATAYFLLTGFLPVSDDLKAGRGFQPSDLSPAFPPIRTKNPAVSEGLERLLERALDLDVRKRYASADEMRIDLEKLKGNRDDPSLVVYCPKCGRANKPHLVYCEDCEAVLYAGKQCPSCRRAVPANARFCPRDGTPMPRE